MNQENFWSFESFLLTLQPNSSRRIFIREKQLFKHGFKRENFKHFNELDDAHWATIGDDGHGGT